MRVAFVFLASALVAGCTTNVFSSNSIKANGHNGGDAIGISYSLPRAVIGMRVLAVRDNAQIVACVREAIAVSDPGQQYYMQFQNNPFSADHFVVKRNELLGTLQEIDIKAQDQFDKFVVNLGTSAGAIVSGRRAQNALTNVCTSPPANSYELGDIEFDPVNPDDYERSINAVNVAATIFIKERLRDCAGGKSAPNTEACREYRRLSRIPDEDIVNRETGQRGKLKPIVRMKWALPNQPRKVAEPRCEVGFCYRHTLPHTMHLIVGDSSVYSHTFQIPNSSPVVSLDLTRAIAVTKTTKITFGRLGEITQIDVKKGQGDYATGQISDGAEAVELALLPASVINAYFSSVKATTDIVASMFTSQKSAIDNRKSLIDSEVALANAKKALGSPGTPRPESSVDRSNGFVLAASNAVARTMRGRPEDTGEGLEERPRPESPTPAENGKDGPPGEGGKLP